MNKLLILLVSANKIQNMLRTVLFAGKTLSKFLKNSGILSKPILIGKMASTPKKARTVDASNLVWVDCEMTGLNLEVDKLLEIAVIITDKDLNILEEGPNLVIHQSDEVS